jgi:probable F420-dependent oxidoreductase
MLRSNRKRTSSTPNTAMTIPFRVGLTLVTYDGTHDQLLVDAALAERLGYDDVWFGDVGAPDALTMAAVVADRTETVRIGTAVTPVFTRTPAVLAATSATLHQLSGGRFMLGLGSSSERMVESWHGLSFEHPLARVRETTQLVRQLLAGEKSDFTGRTLSSHGYRQAPIEGEIPIYLAALRPRMLRLAAEIGDGVIFNFFPRSVLPSLLGHVEEGARSAGKEPGSVEVVCRFQVAVTEQVDLHINYLRHFLAPYFAQSVYNRFLAFSGYQEMAATIADGWAKKDRQQTMEALTDELIHDIAIIGDEAYCQERIREYARDGIHTHIISCPSLDPVTRLQTFSAFGKEKFDFPEMADPGSSGTRRAAG